MEYFLKFQTKVMLRISNSISEIKQINVQQMPDMFEIDDFYFISFVV